jgi:decaprenylphospho-beta-D-ribofuranose 2-oxidase
MALHTPVANKTAALGGSPGERSRLSASSENALNLESASVRLSGWGRFPVESCRIYRPSGVTDLSNLIASGRGRTYIARGLGRSYGDAALNQGQTVVSLLDLNRILDFDPSTGILQCEGGLSLDQIIRYALPRGFFIKVTPGTRQVTVGGAIAADVHGKNHHQAGAFSNSLLDLDLLTAEGEYLTCSRELHPDVFWSTVGGMGLTGFITRARIRLRRIESAYLLVQIEKVPTLNDALAALEAGDRQHEYSAAWVDCISSQLGRALVMLGRHATAAELDPKINSPLALNERRHGGVPFVLPVRPLRQWTVQIFNAAYFRSKPAASERLTEFDPFFYPLDSVQNWNRLYGRAGFVQYQIAVPHAAGATLLTMLLQRIRQSGRAAFLGVLKRFGPGGAGMLSFPMEGATLAIDLPADPGLPEFLTTLDEMVVDHGGRVYLAKDAVLGSRLFERMYPRLDEFRQVKRRLDPRGRISSSLARRLKIVDA